MTATAKEDVRRRVSLDTGANFVLLGVSLVLGLVTALVLARLLGAEGLGTYLWCWSAANVLGIVAKLGLELLVLREVAISRDQGRWGSLVGIARFATRSGAGAAVLLGGLTVAIGAVTLEAETWWTLLPAMVLVVVMTSVGLVSAGVRGLGAVVAANVPVQAVRPLALLGLVAGLGWWGAARPETAMTAHLAAWALAWLVAVAFWRRKLPAEAREVVPEQQPRRWLGDAAPLLVLTSMTALQNQASVLMLKGLADSASTGIFGVVLQLALLSASVLVVLVSVVQPRFAALHAAGHREELQSLVTFATLAAGGASLLFTGAMVAVGPTLLGLYAEGFEAGYPALIVLMLGQSGVAFSGTAHQLMVMTGHGRELGAWSVISATVAVALNAALIPSFGLLGAAVATASVKIGIAVVLAVRVRRLIGIDSTVFGWFRTSDPLAAPQHLDT